MVRLEDYLYQGDTIFKILKNYSNGLEESAFANREPIDLVHSRFLNQIYELLEHNEFLTSQSQRMKEFYKYMVEAYPYLAFTFKGRIKSLIRSEEKFNRYIAEFACDYYKRAGKFPTCAEMKEKLGCFRDLIAYRIVISLPRCREADEEKRKKEELKLLYEIADALPGFLQKHAFDPVRSGMEDRPRGNGTGGKWENYYRDYVASPTARGYQSLHLTLYDLQARCYIEVQLRTKEMDDVAEIGRADHRGYEETQSILNSRWKDIPKGECRYYDEACDRLSSLEKTELSKLNVNMFAAVNNNLINDGCGLFRGRQILPFEHLSRFQNGIVD